MDWFLNPVKNHYADFEGRATRQEFWMYILVYLGIAVGVVFVGMLVRMPFLYMLFSLGMLLPNISITTRRLHDVNKSGWWQLISFIPVLGGIILIIFLASKAKDEGNQYGSGVAESNVAPRNTPDMSVANSAQNMGAQENTQA